VLAWSGGSPYTVQIDFTFWEQNQMADNTVKSTSPLFAKAAEGRSRGQVAADDLSALLRARNPAIWIATREEARVEVSIVEAAGSAGYRVLFWDCASGIADITGREPVIEKDGRPQMINNSTRPLEINGKTGKNITDPGEAFAAVRWFAEREYEPREKPLRIVWVFRDLPAWLEGQIGITPTRTLRNLAKYLPSVTRKQAQSIIVLTTTAKIPPDLAGHVSFIDWPLPDRSEIAKVIEGAINSLPEFATDPETGEPDPAKPIRSVATTPESKELSIDAAVGLTQEEAQSCYAKSIVIGLTIEPSLVMAEKKRIISASGLLEWHDPIKGGMEAVGGLENLKAWLAARKEAHSPAARAYGLPAPKGAVLVGISGCGKSLTAKCTATGWQWPLIRLDLGKLKAKYVGDSEQNIRAAFKVIETIDRCVVWIDEIEKAMAGSASGAGDGGVSADALSVVLNWMQERTSNAFVIATANNTDNLPPELLRKGRFDEIFYVGLPNDEERDGVIRASLKSYGRTNAKIDTRKVVAATEGFTGAEIAELVPTSLYVAYQDGAREIETQDLLNAADDVNPLSKTKPKMIQDMQKWGEENARSATAKAKTKLRAVTSGRDLDI
jgi:ATPase family associated with various cellular activities (AAA)